jgi:threonine dehydrogenase-like Zn-dependent dehydrogenase
MKAINIEKEFENSKIINIDEPILQNEQSLLNVKAVGICQSDIARVFNQSAYYYPIILGHEFSGVLENGDKATIFPIIPCMECDECKKENYAQCKSYSYYGSRQSGGMQERIAINNWNIIKNNNLDFDELSVIEPSAVAMNACKKVPKDAETILINGCGFIALVTAQILLYNGKKVYIRNRNKEKLKYSLDNFNLIEYNNQSIDCAIDFVSRSESINFIIDNIKSHGTIITVGNPTGDIVI